MESINEGYASEKQLLQVLETFKELFKSLKADIMSRTNITDAGVGDLSNKLEQLESTVSGFPITQQKQIKEVEKLVNSNIATLKKEIANIQLLKGDKGDKGDAGESIKGDTGDIKELSPDEIRDSLELLQEDERLDWTAIKGLEDKLKEIKEMKQLRVGGGGNSDSNVKFSLGRILKTETPSGLINSVNTTYTVTQDIHAVFSFGINGMVLHSDEYSISGKTIEFTTALPTALSGTSFEIIYG